MRMCGKFLMIAMAVGMLSSAGVQASTITWQGVSSTTWSSGSAWAGGVAPANDIVTDTALFDSGSINDPVLTASYSVMAVNFNRSATVSNDATLRTLSLGTSGVRIVVTNASTATFNVNVNSIGGDNNIGAGSTLTFNYNAPVGGLYNIGDGARLEFRGANIGQFNYNPLFRGTGEMLFDGTIGGSFRIQLADSLMLTIGTNAAVTSLGSSDNMAAFGTNTICLQKDFSLQPASGGILNVGVDASRKNRIVELTISAGTNTLSVNSVKFWGTDIVGGKNPKLIMDGGTLQVGGTNSNPSALQGFLLTDHGGSLNTANQSLLTDLMITIGSTTNGGVIRVDSPSTFSQCNATQNLGAVVMVTNSVILVNNSTWTNINTETDVAYTGLVVAANATVGGTGTFYMAAGVTTNAKYAVISGHVSPGDSGIGTLNVVASNLTWNSLSQAESSWIWELGQSNQCDKLMITGDFLKGTGSQFYFDTRNVIPGNYVLAEWTGVTTFSPDDFSAMNVGARRVSFNIIGKQLMLSVPNVGTVIMIR